MVDKFAWHILSWNDSGLEPVTTQPRTPAGMREGIFTVLITFFGGMSLCQNIMEFSTRLSIKWQISTLFSFLFDRWTTRHQNNAYIAIDVHKEFTWTFCIPITHAYWSPAVSSWPVCLASLHVNTSLSLSLCLSLSLSHTHTHTLTLSLTHSTPATLRLYFFIAALIA